MLQKVSNIVYIKKCKKERYTFNTKGVIREHWNNVDA